MVHHSRKGNSTEKFHKSNNCKAFENYTIKMKITHPRCQWVKASPGHKELLASWLVSAAPDGMSYPADSYVK